MTHRVRAAPPAHLLDDMRALREHQAMQRMTTEQQAQMRMQQQQQERTSNALVNIVPVVRTPEQVRSSAAITVAASHAVLELRVLPLLASNLPLLCLFLVMQTVSDVLTELAVLEPSVRVHESGATARLIALYAQLKAVLDDRHVELEPELEVEASDLLTKMGYLIQAAQANVFKGTQQRRQQDSTRQAHRSCIQRGIQSRE